MRFFCRQVVVVGRYGVVEALSLPPLGGGDSREFWVGRGHKRWTMIWWRIKCCQIDTVYEHVAFCVAPTTVYICLCCVMSFGAVLLPPYIYKRKKCVYYVVLGRGFLLNLFCFNKFTNDWLCLLFTRKQRINRWGFLFDIFYIIY